MDHTIIITRASRCLSIMNIHGARRGLRRTGAGHNVRPRAQLVHNSDCNVEYSLVLFFLSSRLISVIFACIDYFVLCMFSVLRL